MIFYLKVYAATIVAFLAIDAVWLAFVARGFYRKHLGYLLADQPNWPAAGIFYLLFVAGIVVFAVAPASSRILCGTRCTVEFYKRNYIEGLFRSPGLSAARTTPWTNRDGGEEAAR